MQQSLSAQLSEEQIVLAFFAVSPSGQTKLTPPHVGLAAETKKPPPTKITDSNLKTSIAPSPDSENSKVKTKADQNTQHCLKHSLHTSAAVTLGAAQREADRARVLRRQSSRADEADSTARRIGCGK